MADDKMDDGDGTGETGDNFQTPMEAPDDTMDDQEKERKAEMSKLLNSMNTEEIQALLAYKGTEVTSLAPDEGNQQMQFDMSKMESKPCENSNFKADGSEDAATAVASNQSPPQQKAMKRFNLCLTFAKETNTNNACLKQAYDLLKTIQMQNGDSVSIYDKSEEVLPSLNDNPSLASGREMQKKFDLKFSGKSRGPKSQCSIIFTVSMTLSPSQLRN
jgi:hypothetical protein